MVASRNKLDPVNLGEAWETQAERWLQWARTPGHDAYWQYHRDQFLRLLPPPGRRTVDIGCGEGRLARDLRKLGHPVIAIDRSPSLVAAARALDPAMDVRLADAAALPLPDASADLAIAFMSLQDIDDMPAAVCEAARILVPGGRLCLAIVHPLNSAGRFEQATADARFVIDDAYLAAFHYADTVERDGLTVTFHSRHAPIEAYFVALQQAGLLVEALREPSVPEEAIVSPAVRRWQRLPLFLHLRAVRP